MSSYTRVLVGTDGSETSYKAVDRAAAIARESNAQLIIVSHQKRTMEAADCLYGVTMQPGGSSRVVSERVAANR